MNKNLIKRAIICGNQTPRLQFRKEFKNEIDEFTQAIWKAYEIYEKLDHKEDPRKVWVKVFLHAAIQNIVSAFNIYISGYCIAPGNLMRQFHESISVAILFSTKALNYYSNFKKFPTKFDSKNAPNLVQKNLKHFDIDKIAWQKFMENLKFYHSFSHSTAFAVSSNAVMQDGNFIIIGSYFDKGKMNAYKFEIISMINAAKLLENIMKGINQQFYKENKS